VLTTELFGGGFRYFSIYTTIICPIHVNVKIEFELDQFFDKVCSESGEIFRNEDFARISL
jgi:hypothetical protein